MPPLPALAPWLLSEAAYTVRFDAWYHSVTAGNDKTDGVVEATSQVYPGALLNVPARQPISHSSGTKSEKSAREIRAIMRQRLGVSELVR